MTTDFPTHGEVGEENVRQYLRRRQEEYALFGAAHGARYDWGAVRDLLDGDS